MPPTHHDSLQGKWCSQTCDGTHSFNQTIALALESVLFTEQLAIKRAHASFLICDKRAARPSAGTEALAFFFAGNCEELLSRAAMKKEPQALACGSRGERLVKGDEGCDSPKQDYFTLISIIFVFDSANTAQAGRNPVAS